MRRLSPLLLAVVLVLPACSDDDSVTPGKNFSVTVNVVDTDGDPVPNLELALWNDSDFLQMKGPDKAACRIEHIQPIVARVRLTIEDIEGQTVRVLREEDLEIGVHGFMWDGLDDDGVHQPTGRYTAHLQGFVIGTDELSYEGTVDMWMVLGDIDAGRVGGATDTGGQIVLTDMRLFPHLYEREDMTAFSENGEPVGVLALTADMVFALRDPVSSTSMYFDRQVTGSGDAVTLVWAPRLRVSSDSVQGPLVAAPDTGDGIPVPDWRIRSYPNPFN